MLDGLAVQTTQVCSIESRVSFETFFAEKEKSYVENTSICLPI